MTHPLPLLLFHDAKQPVGWTKFKKPTKDGIEKWMASNAVVFRGVDDSLLPKKESPDSPNKIDGIDAILQADSAMLAPKEKTPTYSMLVLGGNR